MAFDPFYSVKDDVQASLNNASALFERFKELVHSPNPGDDQEFEFTKTTLTGVLQELEDDTRALEDTISTVRQRPALQTKFGITPSELAARTQFVEDVKNKINTVKKAITNPNLASRQPSVKEKRASLFGGGAGGGAGRGAGDYSQLNEANDGFLNSEIQKQQQILKEQDQDLDEINAGVQKVKLLAVEVGGALDEHKLILEDIDKKADTVGGKMERLKGKIDQLIKKKDSGKICAIFFLMIVLIIIAVFVFMTPSGKDKKK